MFPEEEIGDEEEGEEKPSFQDEQLAKALSFIESQLAKEKPEDTEVQDASDEEDEPSEAPEGKNDAEPSNGAFGA